MTSSQYINIAAVTINQTPLDWPGNEARIKKLIHEAKSSPIDIMLFPELCISGYSCEDMFYSLHTIKKSEEVLYNLLTETMDAITVFGLPIYFRGALYNCCAVVYAGKILGIQPKKHLPREGVHYENRWFSPGDESVTGLMTICGQEVPFGDFAYDFGAFSMAIEICEDAWQAKRASARHTLTGCEIVLNPSASHFAFSKYQTRKKLVSENSRALHCHYIHTNLVGLESGRMIYDGGSIIASMGDIKKLGPRFGFKDGYITVARLSLAEIYANKIKNRTDFADNLKSGPICSIKIAADKKLRALGAPLPLDATLPKEWPQWGHKKNWEQSLTKNEEFLCAEMLGLFDFWRKSKTTGFTVSLSGGCDSAATACLVAQMISVALEELGSKKMRSRVHSKHSQINDKSTATDWIKSCLTTVYLATENSGPTTKNAAKNLARGIYADHFEFDIQKVVDAYQTFGKDVMGRELNWEKDDISLQNIQARARAPMSWLIANLRGSLLLSTSNRSEVAVGYATMDGDTAGGLAPLGGIDKDFLRSFLLWLQTDCSYGLGPIASLSYVNSQIPTAELRPQSLNQSDESDLMPYEILNFIEQQFISKLLAPKAILFELESAYPDTDRKKLIQYLKKFLKLWTQNQWKRERYAPSFMLDQLSLDPKAWCRFPILSSGFVQEMDELDT